VAKPALVDALETIKNALPAAIAASGVSNKGQGFIGQPIGPEVTKILAQNDAEYVVYVFPNGSGSNTTRYEKRFISLAAPPNGLTAAISPLNVVTFAGTLSPDFADDTSGAEDVQGGEDVAIAAIYNVYVLLAGYPNVAAYVQTTNGMTLGGLAAALAVQINALGLSGVTAAAVGAALTVTGANVKYCNIGSAGTIAREVGRVHRMIQVSVWSSDPIVRFAVGDAILQGIGTDAALFLQMNNGSELYCRYASDALDETSENEYTLFVQNFIFECEYGVIQIVPAYQIEEVQATETIANFSPATAILGGLT
jgi:hypothetical protein